MSDNVSSALQLALEASIFQEPRDPGLTAAEVLEVLKRLDFKPGEINDAIADLWRTGKVEQTHSGRLRLDPILLMWPMMWGFADDQYPAKTNAVDFPVSYLRNLQRDVGRDEAKISRSDLVAAGIRESIDKLDMEVAITLLGYAGQIKIDSDIVALEPGKKLTRSIRRWTEIPPQSGASPCSKKCCR